MQQSVLLSPKLGRSLRTFSCRRCKEVTVVCETDCLACQDEFFVNSPFDVKENYEYVLDFGFHLSPFFSLGEFGLFHLADCCFVSGP
jgi:hypothetical protein